MADLYIAGQIFHHSTSCGNSSIIEQFVLTMNWTYHSINIIGQFVACSCSNITCCKCTGDNKLENWVAEWVQKIRSGGNQLVSLSLDAGGGGGFAQLVLTQE